MKREVFGFALLVLAIVLHFRDSSLLSGTASHTQETVAKVDEEKSVNSPSPAKQDLSLWATRSNQTVCYSGERQASLPLVSGDGFRCMADAIFDETTNHKLVSQWTELSVLDRPPIIFVKADLLGKFIRKYHERISSQYILVTHNSDVSLPTPRWKRLLEDPKLLFWFAQNTDIAHHDKLTTIPIGLSNRRWGNDPATYLQARQRAVAMEEPTNLLVLNFSPRTAERRALLQQFQNQEWATILPLESGTSLERFLTTISNYKFALSPAGNGLDCHRTWEMLALGVIPIVKTSTLDSVYQAPVLIVQQWQDVTKERLEQHWNEHGSSIRTDKLPEIVTQKHWMETIWRKATEASSQHERS